MRTIESIIDGFGKFLSLMWKLWAGLFDWVPYGDPWVAALALAVVVFIVYRMVQSSRVAP